MCPLSSNGSLCATFEREAASSADLSDEQQHSAPGPLPALIHSLCFPVRDVEELAAAARARQPRACALLLQVFPSEVEIYAVSSQRSKQARAPWVCFIFKLHEYCIRLPKEHFKGLSYSQSCIFINLSFFVPALKLKCPVFLDTAGRFQLLVETATEQTTVYRRKFGPNYELIFSPAHSRDGTSVTYIHPCIHFNEFQMSLTVLVELTTCRNIWK